MSAAAVTQAPGTMTVDTITLASVTTGFVLAMPFSKIHALTEQIAGFPVWTHQLPRVCRDIADFVAAEIPGWPTHEELEARGVDGTNYQIVAAEIVARFGETIDLPPMPTKAAADPIAEAVEMTGGRAAIIAVQP